MHKCNSTLNTLSSIANQSAALPLAMRFYGLLTRSDVQIAGYHGLILFFACLWTETKSSSINTQKKNEANIQPSWLIKLGQNRFFIRDKTSNIPCRTKPVSRAGKITPSCPNHSSRFGSSCPLTELVTQLQLYKSCPITELVTQLQLYKSAVLPYLTYCHLVWNFCRVSDARKLERLQERGLRAVYKNKHASYTQLLERAK